MIFAVIAFMAALALATAGFALYVRRKMLHGPRPTHAEARAWEEPKGELPPGFDSLERESFEVLGPHGYVLRGVAFPGSSGRTVVFHHGIFWNWMGMCKYMPHFLDGGWNIVMFDSRGHGLSGGKNPSYGFFEKDDLAAVVEWARSRFPDTRFLGVYGESMGGATVLQYAGAGRGIDFVVADCPFTSAYDELLHQLGRSGIPRLARAPLARLAELFIAITEGFRLSDASAERALEGITVPVLFAHGKGDGYIPCRMSESMYERIRESTDARLFLAESDRHGQSAMQDSGRYRACLAAFLADAERARKENE